MYTVTIEPEHRLMRIGVAGFWSDAILPAYIGELRRHLTLLEAVGGCRRILVDMSVYPIQSQTVAQSHARIIRHGREELGAATAVVMTSVLSRLQAKRLANLAGHELFDDEGAARTWLLRQPL